MDNSVSVIIPSFNRASKIKRALYSIFNQTHKPDEIIVVDNFSTDNTAEIIKNNFPQVNYIFEKEKGVSFARNRGIYSAKCSWIAFLDSDDEWLPHKLEMQLDLISRSSKTYRLVHTNEHWYKNNNYFNQSKKHKKNGGDIFKQSLRMCCISPSSSMIKKELFNEIGYFDETLPVCEDYDLWLRITSQENVLFLNKPLLNKYGGHKDQLSKKFWGMDRFRVYSIEKLLNSSTLNIDKKAYAVKILKQKLSIIINGAKKRQNKKLIELYENKLKCLSNNP